MRRYRFTVPLVLTIGAWAMWLFAPSQDAREMALGFATASTAATLLLLAVAGIAALRRRQ